MQIQYGKLNRAICHFLSRQFLGERGHHGYRVSVRPCGHLRYCAAGWLQTRVATVTTSRVATSSVATERGLWLRRSIARRRLHPRLRLRHRPRRELG
jgi:hypothetical protein